MIRIANEYKIKFLTTGIKKFNYKCVKIPNDKSKSSFKVNAVISFQPTDKEYPSKGGHCFQKINNDAGWYNISNVKGSFQSDFIRNPKGSYLIFLS